MNKVQEQYSLRQLRDMLTELEASRETITRRIGILHERQDKLDKAFETTEDAISAFEFIRSDG